MTASQLVETMDPETMRRCLSMEPQLHQFLILCTSCANAFRHLGTTQLQLQYLLACWPKRSTSSGTGHASRCWLSARHQAKPSQGRETPPMRTRKRSACGPKALNIWSWSGFAARKCIGSRGEDRKSPRTTVQDTAPAELTWCAFTPANLCPGVA